MRYTNDVGKMNLRLKLGAVLLAVLPLNGPLLACMLPSSWMTDSEKECCAAMQEGCSEQENMPASHSCCASVMGPQQAPLVSTHFSLSPDISIANLPDVLLNACGPQVTAWPFREHTHSPPPVELAQLHILRI